MNDRPDLRPDDPIAEIMVVCTGNIARSPLAAAMLEDEARARLGDDAPVWVRSCGVAAVAGQRAASGSRGEAEARGLDLSHHRGTQADRSELSRSDLVLTMTEDHRARVTRLAPSVADRTFTLPELVRLLDRLDHDDRDSRAPREHLRHVVARAHRLRARVPAADGPEDVDDPVGQSRGAYARMGERLADLVDAVAPHLFGRSGATG